MHSDRSIEHAGLGAGCRKGFRHARSGAEIVLALQSYEGDPGMAELDLDSRVCCGRLGILASHGSPM